MSKKLFIVLFVLTIISILSFTYTFAANNVDPVNGIRNAVGGAENVVEDAGKGIAEGIRNITAGGENVMENVTGNTNGQVTDNRASDTTTTGTGNYTAGRTATATTRAATAGTNNGTFLGMNSMVWTWVIMAIFGAAIVALVWFYGKQHTSSYNNDDNNY